MRWLGLFALLVTLAAVAANLRWFALHQLPLGEFLRLTWPAALWVFGFIAAGLGVGWLSSRWLRRLEEEQVRSAAGRSPGDGAAPPARMKRA